MYMKLITVIISLALVMLIGSVPLGFSEPLRVQLEQGIETEKLQCNNPNHVLVLRTNGNVACLTEKNAEKMGWELFFPNNGVPIYGISQFSDGEPRWGNISITISELPNYGETVVVTVTDQIGRLHPTGDTALIGISLTSQFEFVDLEPTYDSGTRTSYYIEMDITDKDSISFSATIKVIGEGNGMIKGSGGYSSNNTPANIQMIISENKDTVLGAKIEPKTQAQIASADAVPEPPRPVLPTHKELEQAKEEARIRNQDFNRPLA